MFKISVNKKNPLYKIVVHTKYKNMYSRNAEATVSGNGNLLYPSVFPDRLDKIEMEYQKNHFIIKPLLIVILSPSKRNGYEFARV